MEPLLPQVLSAVFEAAFSAVLKGYQEQQASIARNAIVRQLERGKPWAIADDKAAAAMWRYLRAAREGTARRNLDLIAEALIGGATDPEFAPDEFKRQADRLEGVNQREILVLAAFLHAVLHTPESERNLFVDQHEAAVKRAMETGLFHSEEEVDTWMASLVRTGWVAPFNGYGHSGYRATSELLRLSNLVDFEAARDRELDGTYGP